MTDINSKDYHDFVIKNGKLIGEFEQMYNKSSDIPWHQDQQDDLLEVRLAIELLKEYKPFDAIIDLGCGLGYFLDLLKRTAGNPNCFTAGYDISKTCCDKAKALFPESTFQTFNLTDHTCPQVSIKYKSRLFSIRGTLWYVFPKIDNVINNINNMTTTNDLLLISQNFPPLNSNFVGKEVIPNPEAIINLFNKFAPIKTIFLEDKVSQNNNNWFTGIFLRK